MTYISRKERIIVPRWLDENDAEYKLRAFRKRSDARLKRHISCDDLRAWVNNDHLKNEHFLDLMSDGEATGTNRVRLFGRYIPVPVLIKLVQSVAKGDYARSKSAEDLANEEDIKNDESAAVEEFAVNHTPGSESSEVVELINEYDEISKNRSESPTTRDSRVSQTRKKRSENIASRNNVAWQLPKKRAGSLVAADSIVDDSFCNDIETYNGGHEYSEKMELDNASVERTLFEYANLLGRALGKLQRIDDIATLAIAEAENAENEELKLKELNFQSKSDSSSCNGNLLTPFDIHSRSNIKKARDSVKYMELLRKISCLRQKLKKIQDCRLKINEQMRLHREAKFYSNQVTELYSRREQAKIKRLQRKLEKLISAKGKLLSELTDAVSCLNKLKRSASRSRSTIFSKQNASRTSFDQDEHFHLGEPVPCACGCQCSENNLGSSESDKFEFSDSLSSGAYCNGHSPLQQDDSYTVPQEISKLSRKTNPTTNMKDHFYYDKDPHYKDDGKNPEYKNSGAEKSNSAQEPRKAGQPTKSITKKGEQVNDNKALAKYSSTNKEPKKTSKTKKPQNKSKLKFICPESASTKTYSEDLEYYQSLSNKSTNPSVTSKPMKYSRRALDSGKNKRPNSSPIEKSIRREPLNKTPARKFKSETTMKEIEKALRNYDERLTCLDSLENKIERLREKLSDSNRKRQELMFERDAGKKEKANEREKSNREISKLCSENWELKVQVQKLAAKSDIQCRKLQTLKSSKKKVKELETEAEDLKKELSEYQDSFQDQRKCITMLESVVAVQRTEIEKLMNLIKKLTTMDRTATCSQDKRNVQRSRSYSPESRNSRRTCCKPKSSRYNVSSDEDGSIVCCEDYYQGEMRRNQQKNFDRRFFSAEPTRRLGWCVN